MKKIIIFFTFLAVTSCANSIPSNQDDICDILNENPRWQNSLLNAKQKWNADPSTVMAIIRQESSFDSNAAPDREKILGFIPWKRPTSAKGYSLKQLKAHGRNIKKKQVKTEPTDQILIIQLILLVGIYQKHHQ